MRLTNLLFLLAIPVAGAVLTNAFGQGVGPATVEAQRRDLDIVKQQGRSVIMLKEDVEARRVYRKSMEIVERMLNEIMELRSGNVLPATMIQSATVHQLTVGSTVIEVPEDVEIRAKRDRLRQVLRAGYIKLVQEAGL